MPRDGSNIYSAPPGTTAITATTIASTPYNAFTADLVTDLNAARPITAGGTGRTAARLLDGTWRFENTTDPTKLLAFDLSGLTTATTRTLAVQDKNGSIALVADYATTATAAGTTVLTVASATTQYFTGTTTQTVTLPVTSTLALGWPYTIVNNSTGLVTVNSSGGNLVAIVAPGTRATFTCILITGTSAASWDCKFGGTLTLGTPQVSTSGTSVDFTGIPSWVRRITISLSSVSTNGTSPLMIQIGDSGGIEATDYKAAGSDIVGAAAANYTTGFGIGTGTTAAALHEGFVVLALQNPVSFNWTCSGNVARSDAAQMYFTAGRKALSAELDRVRITTVGGVNTFDGGGINILYE